MKTDIAWCAGLFDGEGCISTSLPGRYQPRLEIKMTHKPTIERFASILGGTVSYGYEERGNRRKQHRWRVYNSNARRVILLMLPFLVTKKKEAELFNFIFDAPKEKRLEIDAQIKALKRVEFE